VARSLSGSVLLMHASKVKAVWYGTVISFALAVASGCKPPEGAPGQAEGGADRDVEGRYVNGAAQQPSSNSIVSNNVYLQGNEPKTAQDSTSASSGVTNHGSAAGTSSPKP
jgi:hypothetical protein